MMWANMEMLQKAELKDFLRQTQTGIQVGRTCDPGDFYLIHVSTSSTDPFTGEPIVTETNEYLEPVVYEMKGDERIVVQGGLLNIGDITCSFPQDDGIIFSDVKEVVWKTNTYLVLSYAPYDKGLGPNASRQRLFCKRRE